MNKFDRAEIRLSESLHFFLSLFLTLSVYSQSESSVIKQDSKLSQTAEQESKELNDRWNKALGSFQFQIIDSRINPQVSISTIDLIEKNRLADKVNYIDFREHIRIMILPKSVISKEFTKLDLFKYISSSN